MGSPKLLVNMKREKSSASEGEISSHTEEERSVEGPPLPPQPISATNGTKREAHSANTDDSDGPPMNSRDTVAVKSRRKKSKKEKKSKTKSTKREPERKSTKKKDSELIPLL